MTQCPQKMEQLKLVLPIMGRSNVPEAPPLSSLGQKGSQDLHSLPAKFRNLALQTSTLWSLNSLPQPPPPRPQGLLDLRPPGWGGGRGGNRSHTFKSHSIYCCISFKGTGDSQQEPVGKGVPLHPQQRKENTQAHVCLEAHGAEVTCAKWIHRLWRQAALV